MDKETREDLEEKHKAHFEERFDTKEAAETKLQKLDDNEGAGSWSG